MYKILQGYGCRIRPSCLAEILPGFHCFMKPVRPLPLSATLPVNSPTSSTFRHGQCSQCPSKQPVISALFKSASKLLFPLYRCHTEERHHLAQPGLRIHCAHIHPARVFIGCQLPSFAIRKASDTLAHYSGKDHGNLVYLSIWNPPHLQWQNERAAVSIATAPCPGTPEVIKSGFLSRHIGYITSIRCFLFLPAPVLM